jgi:putative peptidoglycan lipid II flippase
MGFAMVFLGLYGVLDSILNAHHRYILSALASLWRVIGAFVGVLILADFWHMPGVAIGLLAGTALQCIFVLPGLRGRLVWKTLSVDLRNPRLKESLKRLAIVSLVIGTGQINQVIERLIASLAGEGAVSSYGYGFSLITLLPLLLAMPVYKVLYPEMLRLMAAAEREKLRMLFSRNLFLVAFVAFPITAGFISFSTPVTELVFLRGRFSAGAAVQTADVIRFLSLTLFPSVAIILVAFYFLAAHRVRLLWILTVVSVTLNAVLGFGLMHLMGVALASSLGAMVRLGILLAFLSGALGGFGGGPLVRPITKLMIAAVVAGIFAYHTAQWLAALIDLSKILNQILGYGAVAAAGFMVYLGVNLLLGNEGLLTMISLVKRNLMGKKQRSGTG